jgi:crotonobetainyl-CoA:carnitine CoA-transferase CaiB-like acyl-CoA transferase
VTPKSSAIPLSSCRVVELGTGTALAYCGKLFADFGAEVIKLEPAGGDPARLVPPLVDVGDGTRESGYFAWLNTNKRSAIDTGTAAVRELIAVADVLLDARPPAQLAEGPLAHAGLRRAHPALVIAALSWFGESGPYRGFAATDFNCRALAGLVKLIGPVEGPPVAINDHQAGVVGGLAGFIAAMAGLQARGGAGRRFAVSIHEANVALAEYQAALGVGGGIPLTRQGINRFAPTCPMGIFPCREGWIGITVITPVQWRTFCTMLGMPDVGEEARFATAVDRSRHADELDRMIAPRLRERSAAEWFALALERRLPLAIVPDVLGLLREKVHRERGSFVSVGIGSARFEAPILPQRLTRTPPLRGGVAPRRHAHDVNFTERPRTTVPDATPAAGPPLAGLRIVDLSMGWAGPLVTRQLADLGAEIVKVEACQYPDWWRGVDNRPIFFEEQLYEKRPPFLVMNRNKLGVTLDLTSPDGAALLKRLVARADAVVENYARDVLPKLGLDYAALRAAKPDLVMVSMPAFGATGAWADCRAYGSTLEHASGLPSVAGNADWPPTMSHIAYGDAIGGLNAAAALLIALFHRARTGEGQHIDMSQVECMLPLVAPWIIEQSATGRLAPRLGSRHPMFVPQGCFPCAGEDAWVAVSVTSDAAWQPLCRVIERADLAADAGLVSAAGRRAREDEIEAAIAAWTQRRSADQAMAALQAAGIAAGAVRSPFELQAEPHLAARRFWQQVDRPFSGPHVQPSAPYRENGEAYAVRRAAPTLGQDNDFVLGELLGLSAPDIAALRAQGVVGTTAILPSQRRARASTG